MKWVENVPARATSSNGRTMEEELERDRGVVGCESNTMPDVLDGHATSLD